MSSIELYVQDVVTRTRQVTIEDKCPKCGADLRGTNAIVLEQYEASRAWMTIPEEDDVEWGNWEKSDSRGTEGYISIGYTCANCNEWLITAQEEEIMADVAGSPNEDDDLLHDVFNLVVRIVKNRREWLKQLAEHRRSQRIQGQP